MKTNNDLIEKEIRISKSFEWKEIEKNNLSDIPTCDSNQHRNNINVCMCFYICLLIRNRQKSRKFSNNQMEFLQQEKIGGKTL